MGREGCRSHQAAIPVFLLGILAAPLAAQDSVVVVPYAPACGTCSLTVSAVVELGDREGTGIVGEQAEIDAPMIATTTFPRSCRKDACSDSHPTGSFGMRLGGPARDRESTSGRYGGRGRRCPDHAGYRRFRLTTNRGGAIATTRLSLLVDDYAVLPDGRHICNGFGYKPDQSGQPLHLYDEASGRVTHSFGGEGVRPFQADQPPTEVRRRVAPAADGQIWAASWNRYRIDKWDPDGDRIYPSRARRAFGFIPGKEWPGVRFEGQVVAGLS